MWLVAKICHTPGRPESQIVNFKLIMPSQCGVLGRINQQDTVREKEYISDFQKKHCCGQAAGSGQRVEGARRQGSRQVLQGKLWQTSPSTGMLCSVTCRSPACGFGRAAQRSTVGDDHMGILCLDCLRVYLRRCTPRYAYEKR